MRRPTRAPFRKASLKSNIEFVRTCNLQSEVDDHNMIISHQGFHSIMIIAVDGRFDLAFYVISIMVKWRVIIRPITVCKQSFSRHVT